MTNNSSFAVPTLRGLIDRGESEINSRVPGADAKLRRSVLHVLSRVVAGMAHGLYGFQKFIARQIFPSTATGEELIRHGQERGILKLAASRATGSILFDGLPNITVMSGAKIRLSNGSLFTVTENATSFVDTISIPVQSDEFGFDSNVNAGVSATLISSVEGISSSTGRVGKDGLTGGADTESDTAMQSRILERIQAPPHGGSESDYLIWGKEASPNVTRVWPQSLGFGPGTVVVRFVTDNSTTINGPENLFRYSDQLTNSFYDKNNSSLTQTADPYRPKKYGSAFFLGADAGESIHSLGVSALPSGLASGEDYKVSIAAKVGAKDWLWVRTKDRDGNEYTSWFDLSAGVKGSISDGHAASIEALSAGWELTTIGFQAGTGSAPPEFEFGISSADSETEFDAFGVTDGIYLLAPHLRRASVIDDYVKTVAYEVVAHEIIPSQTEVALVHKYLNDAKRRPVVGELFTVAPLALPVKIVISKLTPDTETTRNAVELELKDLFARHASVGEFMPVSKIWEAVSVSTGERSHTIISPATDVGIAPFQIPILGSIGYE